MFLLHDIFQDSLVLDTPRLRRQVRRYGNDSIEEIVEMNEAIDEVSTCPCVCDSMKMLIVWRQK